MASETPPREGDLLRRLTLPVAVVVMTVVAFAWYITWSTGDLVGSLMAMPMALPGLADLMLFFALLVVMMVAMMLPSALPMVLTYHGLTRLHDGRPTRPADLLGSVAFASSYFVVWGAFSVAALWGLMAFGLLGPLLGPFVLVPAVTLIAAGGYQATRAKQVCLHHCQSPMGFVMAHWRPGRLGAMRMGLHHAAYCIGCCWLFMVALFVVGAMSLPWMGLLSLAIFAEKLGPRTRAVSFAIGVLLAAFGAVLAAGALRILGA